MNAGKRIRSLRESKQLTQEQLAKMVGVSRVSISKWESEENKPKGDHLFSLANALGVEAQHLIDAAASHDAGKFSPAFQQAVTREQNPGFLNAKHAVLDAHQVPVLSYVQAGQLTEVREIRDVDGSYEYVQADDDIGERSFGMRISGDSMTPLFDEGDLVIIDPDIDPVPGDYVAAKNGSREATFKKYRPRGFNQDGVEYFELIPLNDDYAPIRSDMCQVTIIGTMIEHRKYRRKRR